MKEIQEFEKLSEFAPGQTFKNYKELCISLDIKQYKSGSKSYKLQLERLSLYCDYHKEGHRIIIDKIHDEPKRKISNKNLLVLTIEKAIIQELFKHTKENNGGSLIISKSGLMRKIGLYNHNCYYARLNPLQFAQHYGLDEEQTKDILSLNHRSGLYNITKAINNLKKQRLITTFDSLNLNYGMIETIKEDDIERAKNDITQVEIIQSELTERATEKQINYIMLVAERTILDKHGLDSIDDIYNLGFYFVYNIFYPEVMEFIHTNSLTSDDEEIRKLSNLHHYYKTIVINFEPSFIQTRHERLGSLTDKDKNILSQFMQLEQLSHYNDINERVDDLNQKQYIRNATTRHKKAIKNDDTKGNRHMNDYVDTTKRINCICYDADSKAYFVKGDKDIRKAKIIIN